MGGEFRRPAVLLFHLRGRPVDAGQPDELIVAEAVERVVGPGGEDGCDGQIIPLGWEKTSKRRTRASSVSTSSAHLLPEDAGNSFADDAAARDAAVEA